LIYLGSKSGYGLHIDHPREGEIGERLVGVASAHVSVGAGEPTLAEVDGYMKTEVRGA